MPSSRKRLCQSIPWWVQLLPDRHGSCHDVANDWEKMNYLLAWVSHAHDGVRRSAARAGLLRWLSWCVVLWCTSTPCSARTGWVQLVPASYCLGPCHRALACCPSRARESTNDDDARCNSSLVLPGLGSSVLQYAFLASAALELPLFAAENAVPALFAREGQGHLPPSTWQVQSPWHMTRLHRVKHQRLSPSVQEALRPCITTSWSEDEIATRETRRHLQRKQSFPVASLHSPVHCGENAMMQVPSALKLQSPP